ncbi:MAG: solute carrier family 26 protein [Myxococcota bacterium]
MRPHRIISLIGSLRGYERESLRDDVLAGLTTAVMLIPQGMGYAMLAGLQPIHGLYASLLPLVAYALFGTSRQLAVGPVAMVSLLVATGVGALADAGSTDFVLYATLLALMVGVLQTLMGIGRLGFLVNFISHPVISGFTSAAALIIGFSQLKHLLGFHIPRNHHIHTIALHAGSRLEETNSLTLAIGVMGIAILLVLKRCAPRWPRALLVVAAATLLVWGFELDQMGVKVVGQIPTGLPSITLPSFDPGALRELWPIALTIALVGFMESIAVAKKYASLNRYDIDANKELVGLGIANLAAAVSQAYPVTGGFSRTAVNAQAGARTGIATLVTAALVALTLVFLTPLFYYLPTAVLASIIITAVFSLIDVSEAHHLWKVKRSDLAMLALTFFATLALGIEQGIAVGVISSLLVLIYNSTRPHVALLGRLPGTTLYRNLDRFPEAIPTDGVLAFRLDSQFYFGNVNFLKGTLERLEATNPRCLRAVVLEANGINAIDASGESALREITESYQRRGVRFILANLKGPVRDVLERSNFYDVIGRENVFHRIEDAMASLCESENALGLMHKTRNRNEGEAPNVTI